MPIDKLPKCSTCPCAVPRAEEARGRDASPCMLCAFAYKCAFDIPNREEARGRDASPDRAFLPGGGDMMGGDDSFAAAKAR